MDTPAPPSQKKRGRPRDLTRDGMVLAATLDLLAERAYEQVSLDEVAARTGRAKTTLYRRWGTKDDLVLAAVRSMGYPPEIDELPDRGSLRDDLIAVIDSPWLGGASRRLTLFAGLSAASHRSATLRDMVATQVTQPYVEVYRRLLIRAVERGLLSTSVVDRVASLAAVIPAMSGLSFAQTPAGPRRDDFVSIVDDVLLPACGAAP
ncbi:TetR family transcriptional regulator [Microbacterium sp. AG157]|uniref:TetR family transcriptional regulator n=1 Tax=Microbacterium testaceum TaxID=2033 RepID=A0A4Y3QJA9_MICTE|nr:MULTISPECIES: TetR/AcrR family transcriptional regulator [Microbacterium]REC98591.1 TetR family transcriptional regulator [Microbacterium sp. AG157]WJS90178.1 TetR/AcrR family transcriptional regulator [Microbacterium testaceum]GEB45315.1 TetR family transcriptional regulator [Microbacterium testaceum]